MALPKLNSRFLHPYYMLNGLLIVTYAFLRVQRFEPGALGATDMFGVTREAQVYICLAMMLFIRVLSAPTMDAYLSSAFSFCRVSIIICLYYMDTMTCAMFLTLWVAVYALCPQPRYKLPASVTTLNPVTFGTRTNPKHAAPKSFHVIWCHAPWSSRSSQLTPVLATLVSRYEHPRINFARVDVSRFPQVADTLKIATTPTSKQLPCVVVFEHGNEIARIPVTDDQNRIPKQFLHGFSADDVDAALGLSELHARAVRWEAEAQKRYKGLRNK